MKVITTNLLNRFWKNGIKPIKDSITTKLNASKVVASTNITQAGFVMDGKTCSDALQVLNSNLTAANWQVEQQVGTYRGVPLYRKTVITNMGAFTAASTLQVVTIPHGITGIAKVVKSEAMFGTPTLMYTNFFTTPTGAWETFLFSTSTTNVIFRNKATWGSIYELHITIHYTKL